MHGKIISSETAAKIKVFFSQKLPDTNFTHLFARKLTKSTHFSIMESSNASQTSIAQDDFGSLGLPVDPDDLSLENVVDLPVLSRRGSETSLMDLSCESNGACDSKIVDQLNDLFKITRRTRRVRATRSSDTMRSESVDQMTVDNDLPPPRRYARRFWVGLARRLTQLKRMRMFLENTPLDSECSY